MRADIYAEYVEHPSIPGGRYYVGLDGRTVHGIRSLEDALACAEEAAFLGRDA